MNVFDDFVTEHMIRDSIDMYHIFKNRGNKERAGYSLRRALALRSQTAQVSDDVCAWCGKTHREHVVINMGHVFHIRH